MNRDEYSKKIIYKGAQTLLPKRVIFAAIHGEKKAMQKVLQHYEWYINQLSSRKLYDCYGNIYIYHDPILKTELQNKLIVGILKLRIIG